MKHMGGQSNSLNVDFPTHGFEYDVRISALSRGLPPFPVNATGTMCSYCCAISRFQIVFIAHRAEDKIRVGGRVSYALVSEPLPASWCMLKHLQSTTVKAPAE